MKEITMNTSRCGANGWHEDGTKTFRRISRWITVKTNYHPAKNNCLWEYVTDGNGYKPYQAEFNPENGLYLDYFTFNGKNYAVEVFYHSGIPFGIL